MHLSSSIMLLLASSFFRTSFVRRSTTITIPLSSKSSFIFPKTTQRCHSTTVTNNNDNAKGNTKGNAKDNLQQTMSTQPMKKTKHRDKKYREFPFPYKSHIEVVITNLNNRGRGIGRVNIENHPAAVAPPVDNETDATAIATSWVVEVPFVSVGERVLCEIAVNNINYSEATLVEVLEKSPDRVQPFCKYFGECGGCDYQHMPIVKQREWKRKQVIDCLSRIGHLPIVGHVTKNSTATTTTTMGNAVVVNAVVGTNETEHYRSKLSPHFQFMPRNTNVAPRIGFQHHQHHRTVDIDECKIAVKEIGEAYTDMRQRIINRNNNDDNNNNNNTGGKKRRVTGATMLLRSCDNNKGESNNNNNNRMVVANQKQRVTQTVNGIKFNFIAGEFFQTNIFILPTLVNHVIRHAVGFSTTTTTTTSGNNNDDQCEYLIDAYCGSGLFALSAAATTTATTASGCSPFKKIWGIEISKTAIDNAKLTAQQHRHLFHNCTVEFIENTADKIFDHVLPSHTTASATVTSGTKTTTYLNEEQRNKTVVIIDPPRAGCSVEFLEQLVGTTTSSSTTTTTTSQEIATTPLIVGLRPKRIVYVSCDPATQARDAAFIVQAGYDVVDVTPFDLFPHTRHVENVMVFQR